MRTEASALQRGGDPQAGPIDGMRVLLLTDGSWKTGAGLEAWRHGLSDLVRGMGGDFLALGVEPSNAVPQPKGLPSSAVVPRQARRAAARLLRSLRAGSRQFAQRPAADALKDRVAFPARSETPFQPSPMTPRPELRAIGEVELIIAESAQVANAVRGELPLQRLWCLALPPERAVPGEQASWADPLRSVATDIAGFITDSADARNILERVLSTDRVPVVVLPPFPWKGNRPGGYAIGRARPDTKSGRATASEQLETWHTMLSGESQVVRSELVYPLRRATTASPDQDETEVSPWSPAIDLTPGAFSPPEQSCTRAVEISPEWSAIVREEGLRRIARLLPEAPLQSGRQLSVGIVGFDLKFVRELAGRLNSKADLNVELDEWRGPSKRNGSWTDAVVRSSHTIVAEWARPNAVWLSQVKRPNQRLIVRVHRFELTSDYIREIQIDRVDAVVYIAPIFGERIRDEIGWPVEKLVYIPNFVDVDWLARAKRPGAQFNLGMIGVGTRIKRLDLALDILSSVRRHDPRFTLSIRTAMPFELPYGWRKPDERRFFQRCQERIETDRYLRGAVHFDTWGRDVAAWLQGVGHILSLSDNEGSHSALAEGMVSGCVPLVRPWHGVSAMYDKGWIRGDAEESTRWILECADEATWSNRSRTAQEEMLRELRPNAVVTAWTDLLRGDVDAARRHFGSRSVL